MKRERGSEQKEGERNRVRKKQNKRKKALEQKFRIEIESKEEK